MQKRQNSGYTSIGHLLERGKEDEVLHDVIKSLCENSINSTLIQADSAEWKWEQFYKTGKMNLDMFASFLDGVLKKPEADPLLLQIRVELLVWKKLNLTNFTKSSNSYRLYCIFNRFCRVDELPFEIGPQEINFLFHTLNKPRGSNVPKFLKLQDFIKAFENVDSETLEKFYDEFIVDLVISGDVRAKISHRK